MLRRALDGTCMESKELSRIVQPFYSKPYGVEQKCSRSSPSLSSRALSQTSAISFKRPFPFTPAAVPQTQDIFRRNSFNVFNVNKFERCTF